MPKYVKKPIPIAAEPYRPGLEDGCDECGKPYIETLEGKMYINPTDYIITGIEGERYPCKKDIFEKTYELVEE